MDEDMERQLKRFELKRFDLKESIPEDPGLSSWESLRVTVEDILVEMDKVVDKMSIALKEVTKAIMDNLSPSITELLNTINQYQEDVIVVYKAVELGLVPDRVVHLTLHRRGKVARKNMNRIRRALNLYCKRNHITYQGEFFPWGNG